MLKLISSRVFWGIILVFGGALLLLDTFGIFKGNALFWTLATAIAGVLFLSIYFNHHDNWWAIIPGVIFLTFALVIGLNSFVPGFSEHNFSGPIILGGIALSFFLVYITERSNWWAIIPAGVMSTIAIVAVLESQTTDAGSGGIFFLGLGLTFGILAILPTQSGTLRWAWVPASILGIMGFLILVAAQNLINFIWPVAFILAGLWLIIRSIRS